MTFQPYQLAAEEEKRQAGLPLKLAKKGAILGASIAGGGHLFRLLPFLNKLVPEKIARKGMEKILPISGKFFNNVEKEGYTFDQGRDFLSEKLAPLTKEEEKGLTPKEIATTNNLRRAKRRQGEFGREELQDQFQQQYGEMPTQGKAALTQTMREITEQLRRMRENG